MRSSDDTAEAARAWHEITEAAGPRLRKALARLIDDQADVLAALFYERMLAHPAAAPLLEHTVVSKRLHASMANWLRELFDPGRKASEFLETQQRTGEVHARIGVPGELIAAGLRTLQRAIVPELMRRLTDPVALAGAVPYVYELMDHAFAVMNMTTVADMRRIDRSDEAYRLLFLNRDMRAERERQRSQLLEWAQQILVAYYWDFSGSPPSGGQGFTSSQFGLWLQHKASVLFEGSPEIGQIGLRIEAIENELLPALGRARDQPDLARPIVAAINRNVDEVKALLGSMFDRVLAAHDGRDQATRLLNRRFLPTIARREIALARQRSLGLALLLVDIDRFARIRGLPDPDSADLVVSQVADMLVDNVRAGDFVFRIGEDRFAIVLVEAQAPAARNVAEALRKRVEQLDLRLQDGLTTSVTVSVGVALFDGHPDYQQLLDRSEQALRTAKADGRNRVVVAA